ncbi:MAG: glucose-6-phosphate isomerase [Firmicutes bacterium]|nr:glucose-6-phosphate isomerase [Bacillota bacterium]
MKKITLDYTNIQDAVLLSELSGKLESYSEIRNMIINKTGKGNDFLGWVDLPDRISDQEIEEIEALGKRIREESDLLVVIGIGGSYLGAKAAIDALLPAFKKSGEGIEIVFAGQSLSPRYLKSLLAHMEGRRVTVNVISKSGTTTEPAVAFRIIREWMIAKYGKEEGCRRIIATTDSSKGALRTLADEEGMKTYVIPDDVGGRFSVLTPVGLVPIAAAGISIKDLVQGARDGAAQYRDEADVTKNPSAVYAAIRNILYKKGKTTEILSNFEPQLHYVAEWWKQLYGESEGKENKGIFPASCDFTTDLHSMGQWIQEGLRNIFETFINVEDSGVKILLGREEKDLDKLNYLEGETLEFVNRQAFLGTASAHRDGGVPNMTINLPDISAYSIGKLFYFFEWGVAVSGYMLGVNPFDQPGVESYKKNMFALLGKPGLEKETQAIREKLAGNKLIV